MTIMLSPKTEKRIRDLVESGKFEDENTAIEFILDTYADDRHLMRELVTRSKMCAQEHGTVAHTPELYDAVIARGRDRVRSHATKVDRKHVKAADAR